MGRRGFFFISFFLAATAMARPHHKSDWVDVNGDGYEDRCGRTPNGIICRLGKSNYGYGRPQLWTIRFSDAAGWNKPYYGRTVQFADVNGDGLTDVCGRGGDGMYCGLSQGHRFADGTVWSTLFANLPDGWDQEPYYETIRVEDLDGDGKADIHAYGPQGYVRLYSDGTGFEERDHDRRD